MLSLTKDHRNLLSQTDCNDRCLVFAATLDHSSLMVCLHSASECLSWNGQLLQFLTLLLCDVLHDTIHHHHTDGHERALWYETNDQCFVF